VRVKTDRERGSDERSLTREISGLSRVSGRTVPTWQHEHGQQT